MMHTSAFPQIDRQSLAPPAGPLAALRLCSAIAPGVPEAWRDDANAVMQR